MGYFHTLDNLLDLGGGGGGKKFVLAMKKVPSANSWIQIWIKSSPISYKQMIISLQKLQIL